MQTEELYRYKIQQGETLTFLFWKLIVPIDIKLKFKNVNVINGGRYDKLISDLGSKKQVSAVGAALNLNY